MDSATITLFSFTARQMTRSVKAWLFGLMAAVPWGVVLVLRLLIAQGVPVPMGGVTLYGMLVLGYVLGFFVPLSTLFFGTALIADEVEGGTLPYLFGRPIRREKLFLVRYAAMTAILLAGAWASVLGTYLLAMTTGSPAGELGTLGGDLLTVGLAVAAYGALFSFLGMALKKPLFWGLLIGFGWENLVAWLPGFLKRLTLLFHLHTLLPHASGPQGLLQQLLASSESRLAALLFLLVYEALFLILGCLIVRRMEASAAEREEG
jgi:ABC-type transport system involved in multi-copper enzyme maturation permease subunit